MFIDEYFSFGPISALIGNPCLSFCGLDYLFGLLNGFVLLGYSDSYYFVLMVCTIVLINAYPKIDTIDTTKNSPIVIILFCLV